MKPDRGGKQLHRPEERRVCSEGFSAIGRNEGNQLGSEEGDCFSCQGFVYTVFTFSAAEVKFSMNRLREKDKKHRRSKYMAVRGN